MSEPEQEPVEKPAEVEAPANSPTKADPAKTHQAQEWQHDRPLFSCRVDPQLRWTVTGAQDYTLQRWDFTTGAKSILNGHQSWVRGLVFSHDGQTLVSGGYDGRLLWWPIGEEKPQPVRAVDAHDGWVRAVVISPDGELVATCGNDNLAKIWRFSDGELVQTFAGHERYVYNVAFHPGGEHLVSADLMGVIRHWELATGKEVRTFDGSAMHKYDPTFHADIGGARSMAFSPDGKYFACGSITDVTNAFAGQGTPVVALYDWEKSEPAQLHKLKAGFRGVAWGLAFHVDGFLVASFSSNSGGRLVFFRPDAPNEFHEFKMPVAGYDLDLASDGLSIAVAHADNRLRIYRMTEKAS